VVWVEGERETLMAGGVVTLLLLLPPPPQPYINSEAMNTLMIRFMFNLPPEPKKI
jgi:hypothetical protein